MDFVAATASYESWLNGHITVVTKDLDYKHKIMADNEFVFFRATYYRWLQQLPAIAPALDGPIVACVGDLHMENFGTWQSAGGHLAWGVNDFDESEELPYAFDLARLATSASLAIADRHLHRRVDMVPTSAHDAILRGYTMQLARGGRPFLLDGHHRLRLTRLIHEALPDDGNWWHELKKDKVSDIPDAASETLRLVQPNKDWRCRLYRRAAGVGSRGHCRFVAIGRSDDAKEAREVKEMAPPAGRWLGWSPSFSALDLTPIRAADPWQARGQHWSARRIAPDCIKLELDELDPRGDETRLFEWMGQETANIHLGTPDHVEAVKNDIRNRRTGWLTHAARALAAANHDDWQQWRHHLRRRRE